MSDIFDGHKVQSVYWDRQHYASVEEQLQRMAVSCTVYVDGLDFATPESMIYETFCKVGCIKRVIMGIDAQTKTPCGFCFVEYYRRREAMDALLYLNGTVCDGKVVKCDLDAGYKVGRQFGRVKRGPAAHANKFDNRRFTARGDNFDWKKLREDTFAALRAALAAVDPASGFQLPASTSEFELVLRDVFSKCRVVLSAVEISNLPWSAVVSSIDGHLASIGWNYATNSSTPAFGECSPETRLEHLSQIVGFVDHWTPKQSGADMEVSSEVTVTREQMEPGADLSLLTVSVQDDEYRPEALLRVLPSNFPRKAYESQRQGLSASEREGRHWGQRKLLLTEIEFLTLHAKEGHTVVYAGAAPGNHIPILEELFSTLKLHYLLVDPAPFRIRPSPNVELRSGQRGLFDDSTASELAPIGDSVLFISDIRRTDTDEAQILGDMLDQQRWHRIIKPAASMFKFRLPWSKGLTPYLNGKVYMQPYAQMHSTETRLVVTGSDTCLWDNTAYEEQCFYFNTITRLVAYDHKVSGAGLQNTYDCAAEVEILRAYVRRFKDLIDSSNEEALISELSLYITTSLGGDKAHYWLDQMRSDNPGQALGSKRDRDDANRYDDEVDAYDNRRQRRR